MTATRVLSEFTYRSGVPSSAYFFTIIVDEAGSYSVRNIQTPFGLILDSMTSLPQTVVTDISTALGQVENILATTSAVNGVLVFTNATSASYSFSTAMANTSYRVMLSPDLFVPLRIINKTTAGFTVEAGATVSGSVGFDVFL